MSPCVRRRSRPAAPSTSELGAIAAPAKLTPARRAITGTAPLAADSASLELRRDLRRRADVLLVEREDLEFRIMAADLDLTLGRTHGPFPERLGSAECSKKLQEAVARVKGLGPRLRT